MQKTIGLSALVSLAFIITACAETKSLVASEPKEVIDKRTATDRYNDGIESLTAKNNQRALEAFRAVLSAVGGTNAELTNTHYNIGVILMANGDHDGARSEFEKTLKIDPMHRDALINLGELSKQETNYINAIEIYKNVLRALPNDQVIMNNLVVCYRLNRQYQEAEAIGYQLLAHAPDNIEAYKNMVLVYVDQGNYEMAELLAVHAKKQLEQLRQNDPSIPDDAGLYNNHGLVYFKSGQPRNAQQEFSKALEIKPDHLDALINTGALAHQYRDYARAQVAYGKVLKLDPDNDTALRGLAYAAFGSGDAHRTIDLMNRLIARNPTEIRPYYVLGVVYDTFLHDFAKAVRYYEQYLAKMGFALASNDPVKLRLATAKANLEAARKAKESEQPSAKIK